MYGATVVGVAIGATAGWDAPWWPFLLVLLTYYVNGTVFLAFSSIAERSGRRLGDRRVRDKNGRPRRAVLDDGRSLSFLRTLAGGTETILVHSAWLILPFWAAPIAAGWAIVVAISAVQRIVIGYRLLR